MKNFERNVLVFLATALLGATGSGTTLGSTMGGPTGTMGNTTGSTGTMSTTG